MLDKEGEDDLGSTLDALGPVTLFQPNLPYRVVVRVTEEGGVLASLEEEHKRNYSNKPRPGQC